MSLILILATAAIIGTTTIPGAGVYEWEVMGPAGTVAYSTTEARLTLAGPRGVPLRSRVRVAGGQWSEWSADSWVIDPLPGDLNWDCTVGGPDYAVLGSNFGKVCP